MRDLYTTGGVSGSYRPENGDMGNEMKQMVQRKLRTLRMLLILWVLSFIVVLFWMGLSHL
jgi:hypothetical protein